MPRAWEWSPLTQYCVRSLAPNYALDFKRRTHQIIAHCPHKTDWGCTAPDGGGIVRSRSLLGCTNFELPLERSLDMITKFDENLGIHGELMKLILGGLRER